jgi:hypothetical protein
MVYINTFRFDTTIYDITSEAFVGSSGIMEIGVVGPMIFVAHRNLDSG